MDENCLSGRQEESNSTVRRLYKAIKVVGAPISANLDEIIRFRTDGEMKRVIIEIKLVITKGKSFTKIPIKIGLFHYFLKLL